MLLSWSIKVFMEVAILFYKNFNYYSLTLLSITFVLYTNNIKQYIRLKDY